MCCVQSLTCSLGFVCSNLLILSSINFHTGWNVCDINTKPVKALTLFPGFTESGAGHLFLCTSDLGVSYYVVTQPPEVGVNNRAWMGRPERRYGSWQVQSPHLAPEWNQIYPELCLSSHFAPTVLCERSSGSGVRSSDLSSGHTHRQFHTIMGFKAVASPAGRKPVEWVYFLNL